MRWVLMVWLFSSTALAQDVDEALDREARSLFEAGVTAYSAGRFEEAVAYFQQSYELSGRHQLLYNVGTAAERSRDDALALRSYEEYLRQVPEAENRERVETRIALLRSLGVETERASGPGPAPWILVASGGALAIAGTVLLAIGLADRATVEDPETGARWADVETAFDRGPGLLTAGAIALPIGLAVAAVGLTWALVADDEEPAVAFRLAPDSLSLRGWF
ncbi:MAG: hypothetical protein AAGF12_00920 [Myxococcota bacterium]